MITLLSDTKDIKSFFHNNKVFLGDKKYKFNAIFDTVTGNYVRSGILEAGKETSKDAFEASFPHLLDIGIMATCHAAKVCKQGGVDCYQSGAINHGPNMTLDAFTKIITQCKGKTFEVALGGRGDPNKHENFKDIMKVCRDNFIAPNYTTSGINLTDDEVKITKEYAGAVAVSWQRQFHTIDAINMFVAAGVTTNIHYVLSNKNIDELIGLIEKDSLPNGINALIILNYKNVGQGDVSNVITGKEPNLKKLFELLDTKKLPFKLGFDSCSCQFIGKLMKNVDNATVSSCDSGVFSAYISPTSIMLPCSFDQKGEYGVDLNKFSLEDAWNSDIFNSFKKKQAHGLESGKCGSCHNHIDVCKPCILVPDINICNKE